MALGHINSGIKSPGHNQRNPYASRPVPGNPVQNYTPPAGYQATKYQVASVGGNGLTQWNPQLAKAKPKKAPSLGGASALTPYTPPTVQSSIDYSGLMQNYLPGNVEEQNTNLDVALTQQQASPGMMAERLAGNQGNMASVRSGQNLQQMQSAMQPHMAQVASLNANNPIEAALQRHNFATQALGAQGRDVMSQAGNEMGKYGDLLSYQKGKFGNALDAFRTVMV